MGKAIVSTSVGAEGLTISPDQDILIANDPQGFAKQIVRALESPELRKSLGRAGRCLVESRYGWNMIVNALKRSMNISCVTLADLYPRHVKAWGWRFSYGFD